MPLADSPILPLSFLDMRYYTQDDVDALLSGYALSSHTHNASAIVSGVLDNARVNFAAPGAIGGTTPASIAGSSLSIAPDTDVDVVIGRMRLYSSASDTATIAHVDMAGNNYAFRQAANGETRFNAAATRNLLMTIGGVTYTRIGATGTSILLGGSGIDAASALHVLTTDSATSTVTTVTTLGHNTSSTPVPGYGTGLLLQGESSASPDRDMARIRSAWTTATDASRASNLILSAYNVGTEVDVLTLSPALANVTGTLQADGLRLDVTPTLESITPTHSITVSINGTDYKIPVQAA